MSKVYVFLFCGFVLHYTVAVASQKDSRVHLSEHSHAYYENIEKFNQETKKLDQELDDREKRKKFEASWMGKFCKSYIPPLVVGAVPGVIGWITGYCIDVYHSQFVGNKYHARVFCGSIGFAIGSVPVMVIQYGIYGILKKFGTR